MSSLAATYNPETSSHVGISVASSRKTKAQSKLLSSAELTDKELVKRIQNTTGKQRDLAFAALYTRHVGTAYSVARKLTQNQESVEDIVQESFAKVHRYIGNFRGDSAFSTWFYRIVHNAGVNYLAYESRRPQSFTGDSDSDTFDRGIEQTVQVTPAADVLDQEFKRLLGQALSKLKPELREALLLVTESNLSYADVARIMNVPVGTIRSRVHRARQGLNVIMEELIPGFRSDSSKLQE